jgi:uncharacterized membrane protein
MGREAHRSPSMWARGLGAGLLAVGAVLVAFAVLTGGARLELVVVIPVVVASGSPWFLAGVLCLFGGILAIGAGSTLELPTDRGPIDAGPTTASAGGAGGVVLLGPIPIFFGAWKSPGRPWVLLAAAVGAAMLIAVLVVVWLAA